MPLTQTDVNLVATVGQVLPAVISLIASFHHASNPTTPVPTDAQVMAALLQQATATIMIDENWKAAHPTA